MMPFYRRLIAIALLCGLLPQAKAYVGWTIFNISMTTQFQSHNPPQDPSCMQLQHELWIFRGLHWNHIYSDVGQPTVQGGSSKWTSYMVSYTFGILPWVPEGISFQTTVARKKCDGTLEIMGSIYQNSVLPEEVAGYTSLSGNINPPQIKVSNMVPYFECPKCETPTPTPTSTPPDVRTCSYTCEMIQDSTYDWPGWVLNSGCGGCSCPQPDAQNCTKEDNGFPARPLGYYFTVTCTNCNGTPTPTPTPTVTPQASGTPTPQTTVTPTATPTPMTTQSQP